MSILPLEHSINRPRCRGWMSDASLLLGQGEATPPRARFAPFMAVYLLRKHQIFMLAFAGLRGGRKGGSGARCSPASPLTMALPQLILKKRGNYWGENRSSPKNACVITIPAGQWSFRAGIFPQRRKWHRPSASHSRTDTRNGRVDLY
jgi:hypothetical protein